ncbi:uncharacterized protein LOC135210723 isoform X6 [Macrobrachium nipponense]|uniref:uncharacterized protein LOC135210723 isoform X6 n=1 Tax=Macrobrachium nipponense TaxID=159736 RepID=UPI0030C7E6D0
MEWRLSAIGSGRASWAATELRARGEHKLPNLDSGQNSLEYWDYSVELEMLKGPEDLQLAAELGKTLLERNRELESNLKQQQAVIEDQLQEIEYLSKQTAALREVNDSRLRIYEQLEISIQELEKNNQRLSAEGAADKRKIKGLCGNIESLEARCDELQKNLEEARAGAQQLRGRNKRRSIILEEQSFRRSHSCENTTQTSEDRATEELETRAKIEELQERLKESQNERVGEVCRREELEIQLACMVQENAVLQDQLTVLREKEVTLRTFDEELASLDDASSGRLCRKCLGHVDDSASNSGLYDLHDSIEDTDASIESIHGECALVKLKNGGYAWGSQESLASIGQVVSHVGSGGTSPGTEVSDAPHNSLLSELDTSYRILIEKYEALLEAREQQQQASQHATLNHGELVHPGVDDMSGPMSLVMTDGVMNNQTSLKCQRCHTCTCDLKPNVARPKSNMEEFSEVETSSSGFSDGESRISNKATQTGDELICREIFEDSTPTPTVSSRCLDLSSPINPCDKRFQAAPEYKKLFQEIFSVLKKTVDEKDCQNQSSKSGKTPQSTEAAPPVLVEISQITVPEQENDSKVAKEESNPSPSENDKMQKVNEINKVESYSENIATELVLSADNLLHSKQTLITDEGNDSKSKFIEGSEEQRITHKPPRPDSLDLGGNGSRSSSRQKRRRRHHHRVRLDSLQQQQQLQGQYQYTHGTQIANHIQGQSSHKFIKRDRDHYHAHHNPRQQAEDFPNLQSEGEYSRTRIVYNSSRGKCEHHSRSRKHRDRTNNSHSQRHQQQNNHDISEQSNQNDYQRYQGNETEPKEKTTPKINYPSVEVAKLRKLEMTYAEALKTSFSRSYYNRRY